jgi:DNA invertase Pin-like site-specific DNA recombinase
MKEKRVVAIYARQSVDKKDSVSIESQIDDCKRTVSANEDVRVYTDRGKSGKSIVGRDELNKLIKDIESDLISRVVVYKLDRFARNISDFYHLQKILEEHNCSFVSVTQGFDTSTTMGRAMMGILAVFAQMERENISARIKDNYDYRVKDRRWASGKAPFGFQNGKIDGKTTLIPKPDEAEVVKLIFKLYSTESNISLGKLQDKLNERGITGHQSDRGFSRTTLTRILKNPVYAPANELLHKYYERFHIQFVNDKEEWNGETSAAIVGKNNRTINADEKEDMKIYLTNVEPLIDTETFLLVQDRMAENSAIASDNSPNTNLQELAGLLKCADCKMAIKMQTKPTLTCTGRSQKKICDVSFKGLKLETVQENVAQAVQERIDNFDKFAKEQGRKKVVIRHEIEELQGQMERLIEISKFSTKSVDVLAKEIDDIQSQIDELQLKLKLNINTQDVVEIRLKLKSIYDIQGETLNYRGLRTEYKQTVLRALLDKIYLHKNGEVDIIWKE